MPVSGLVSMRSYICLLHQNIDAGIATKTGKVCNNKWKREAITGGMHGRFETLSLVDIVYLVYLGKRLNYFVWPSVPSVEYPAFR